MFEPLFVRANYRKIDVRIRGGIAVARKMLGGSESAVFFHAPHELGDKFRDALRDLLQKTAC